MSNLIQPTEISGGAVYGVKQYEYTVDGEAGKDYQGALAAASLKQSVAIEASASANADVVRQRQRKVEDLGTVLAAIAKAIATMDPKNNDTGKRSEMLESLVDAQSICNRYGISFPLVAVETSGGITKACVTYRDAVKSQDTVQYALDTENNNLQQNMVALQSLIAKRDNAYSAAAKAVRKADQTASRILNNIR